MAKLKTNSGAKKRFTLTGTGKIKRKKQKRNLDHFAILDKVDERRVKELLVL